MRRQDWGAHFPTLPFPLSPHPFPLPSALLLPLRPTANAFCVDIEARKGRKHILWLQLLIFSCQYVENALLCLKYEGAHQLLGPLCQNIGGGAEPPRPPRIDAHDTESRERNNTVFV